MKMKYFAGGNPPISPGIFDMTGFDGSEKSTGIGRRLAWWPPGYEPTQDRLEIAYKMIIEREDETPLQSIELRAAFQSAEDDETHDQHLDRLMKRLPHVQPARPGDKIIVVIPYYWGKGASLREACSQAITAGGEIEDEWQIYSVDPDAMVNGMGGISHKQGHDPILLCASPR